MTDQQIAAMRQALEALEIVKIHFTKNRHVNEAITAIREALAEQPAQQQEPVAVMTVLHLKYRTEIGYGPASAGYDLPTGEYRLYTSPQPSKQWVGLTDEEIEKLAVENGHATFLNDDEETGIIWFDGDATPFARAIEQKLREKNGG